MDSVIVRDYKGHYRIEEADLDALRQLDKLREENKKLKLRIAELEKACANYNEANCDISNKYLEVKLELEMANERIEELERISVEVCVG